ncbi:TPA: type VI secretion system baseplate subunit TssG [Proteus mirabilis]|nr:type VI secretion system baseplate subunit TssG [Proteus mirabilis]
MASTNQPAHTEVIDRWLEQAGSSVTEYNFYQLVELLNKIIHQDVNSMEDDSGILRFKSYSNIAFPTRDVISIEKNNVEQYELEVAFLGLQGSQSPLPGYYLDEFAWEDAQQIEGISAFLDIFNHRLIALLYRIWRKYRYYICFENEGQYSFSQYMFSLVGLGNGANRGRIKINHSKMLAYAGLLASPSRSSDVISSLISHCFDLENVKVIGWETRRVPIPESQQNKLGTISHQSGQKSRPRMLLGENFSLGSHIYDCNGKCTIEISELSLERYMRFLPNGSDFAPLVAFVSYIFHEQLAWDLRLSIAEKQAEGFRLGHQQHNQLGWQSFLGQPAKKPDVTITVLE